MGTNYYGYTRDLRIAKEILQENRHKLSDSMYNCLNETIEPIHIGKKSAGCKFLFDHNNWKFFEKNEKSVINFINSLEEIKDEYGTTITASEFFEIVESAENNREDLANHFYLGSLHFSSYTDFS